ncbi:FAM92 [Mytilus edulis]|uniref:FAM92 n=1 Tax=Mytilus edulis TaxID=6550 RepID=A0A8S3TMB3_MYTED|nr:FAM92 [Mytilus edulis]
MSQGGSMPRGNESQAKFCQSRKAARQRDKGKVSITRKAARQRQRYKHVKLLDRETKVSITRDLLAKQLQEYANSENISHCTKAGLSLCAQNMSAIQDYREAEVCAQNMSAIQDYREAEVCAQNLSAVQDYREAEVCAQNLSAIQDYNEAEVCAQNMSAIQDFSEAEVCAQNLSAIQDYCEAEVCAQNMSAIQDYGEAEVCAQNMSAIQDYREAEIKRLEAKVVHPMSGYGDICKKKKKDISTELGNIKKEQKTLQQLDKVRTKSPGDQHQIAETEVKKANTDSEMGGKALEEQMVVFEKQRLGDLKNSLADFINIEMIFHARALEYYARCFENIVMIDEDRDLQEFKRKLQSSKGMHADFGQTLGGFTGGSSTGE